jgi:diadenosine tetraphosphate (Ap4A) HIT family hydrolase
VRLLSKTEALALLDAERERMPTTDNSCVMCTLASSSFEPQLVIGANEHALVRINRIPSRPNEMMVLLKEHRERIGEVAPSAYAGMFDLVRRAATVLERRKGAVRVFVAQLGSPEDIRVSYPHIHVHVLPLYEGGESARPSRVFSWTEAVYAYDDGEAELIATALRADLIDMP